jgi:hypothetical protein
LNFHCKAVLRSFAASSDAEIRLITFRRHQTPARQSCCWRAIIRRVRNLPSRRSRFSALVKFIIVYVLKSRLSLNRPKLPNNETTQRTPLRWNVRNNLERSSATLSSLTYWGAGCVVFGVTVEIRSVLRWDASSNRWRVGLSGRGGVFAQNTAAIRTPSLLKAGGFDYLTSFGFINRRFFGELRCLRPRSCSVSCHERWGALSRRLRVMIIQCHGAGGIYSRAE